jgi:hypothetical protein
LSKVAIEGNASGTGTLTIAAPNTNSNFTLDIPSASGTIDRLNRAGNVLQVVSATYSTLTTITSTSYTDTGLTASITPTSASSKILIITSQPSLGVVGANVSRGLQVQLLKNSTSLVEKQGEINSGVGGNGFAVTNFDGSFVYLDSPNTTSSTTYKTQGKVGSATNNPEIRFQFGSFASTMTLLEIAG